MNICEGAERFLEHLQANGCSPHTVRSYRCDLGRLRDYLDGGQASVSALRPETLATFLNSPFARTGPTGKVRGPGAVNRERIVLRSFGRWLWQAGHLRSNPAAGLRARALPQSPPRVLSPDDEKRLLDALRGSSAPLAFRDRVMVEVLLATGMRASELVNLQVPDVDLAARTAWLTAKGGARQARHLRRTVVSLLKCYLKWRAGVVNGSQALFVSAAGAPICVRQFQRRLGQWLDEAGVNGRVTAHTFRHTLATRLLALTGNLRLVQQALGHRNIASTIRYTLVPNAQLAAALEAV